MTGPKNKSHLWKKGQSGNPRGRLPVVGEVRDLARQHTMTAIARLVELMASRDEKIALGASEAILDRGWGRCVQAVSMDARVSAPVSRPITSDMTAQQASEAYAAMLHQTTHPWH